MVVQRERNTLMKWKLVKANEQHILKCPTLMKMEMSYKEYMIKIKNYLSNPYGNFMFTWSNYVCTNYFSSVLKKTSYISTSMDDTSWPTNFISHYSFKWNCVSLTWCYKGDWGVISLAMGSSPMHGNNPKGLWFVILKLCLLVLGC